MKFNFLYKRSISIIVFALMLLHSEIKAQLDDTSFIQYFPFMNELPHDYTYYETGYHESKVAIEDTSVIWSDKEYPYWRFFIANIALLAPDSIIKGIWNEAYHNNPYSICDFYSYIFELPFNAKHFHESPVAYFYLHSEKTYFDSICNQLYSHYDSSLINKMRIIVTDDNGRGNRVLNPTQGKKDSINQIKIASIIEHLGKYPGRSLVGSLQEVGWLVIQHAPTEYQVKYLPYLKKAVEAKDLKPKYLAYTLDRINMAKDQPQVYGTQFLQVGNKNVLYKVQDLSRIDAFRKSVGLEPLKTYMEANTISFD